MTNQPRPESRISSLEKRATTIEAAIEELSSDQAEELKTIRQNIKGLDEGMKSSFTQIGDTLIAIEESLETAKSTMATKNDITSVKEDLRQLEDRIDHKMAAMEGRINGNIAAMETHLVDTIKQLWQQRPSE